MGEGSFLLTYLAPALVVGAVVGISALVGIGFARAFYQARNERRILMFRTEIERLRRRADDAVRSMERMRVERDRMRRVQRRSSSRA